MPKQTVTLEIDVPEGYEATGDSMSYQGGLDFSGREYVIARACIRKLPDPVEDWLKAHPWLPEGRWVYRWSTSWYITDIQPEKLAGDLGYNSSQWAAFDSKPKDLAAIFGHTFTPPPVDLVQVKRPSK